MKDNKDVLHGGKLLLKYNQLWSDHSNAILWAAAGSGEAIYPRFKALAFYSREVESGHVK